MNKTYRSVWNESTGTAFTTVDTALGKLNNSITNINNGAGIKYFHTSSTLADSIANGTNSIAIGGATRTDANNAISIGTASTDAVNVGQLNDAVANAVGDLPTGTTSKQYTDQQINMVQQSVNNVARGAYAGVAAATALTMIPDVDQGKTIAVGVGSANYKGYQATALGASARITQNLKIKLGAGYSSEGTTVGVGASYQW